MNYEELISRDVKELRQLAAKYSIRTGPRSKAETIAKLIIEHISAKPKIDMQHPAEKPQPAPLVINTEEQVREAIAPFLKKQGFEAIFTGENWWFKCRGAEECGHMSVPLRVIRMKAESVSYGARKPAMIDLGDGPIMGVG